MESIGKIFFCYFFWYSSYYCNIILFQRSWTYFPIIRSSYRNFSFVFIILFRYVIKNILCKIELFKFPILIIGGGKTAEVLIAGIKDNYGDTYKIVGFLEDNVISEKLKSYPVLGRFKDAEKIIKEKNIPNVVIAAPGLEQDKLVELTNRIQPLVKNLTIIPNLVAIPMGGIEVEGFFNEKNHAAATEK